MKPAAQSALIRRTMLGLYPFGFSLEAKKIGYNSLKSKKDQNLSCSMFIQLFYSRFSQTVNGEWSIITNHSLLQRP